MDSKFKIYHKNSNTIFPLNGIVQVLKYDVQERLEKVIIQDYLPYNEYDNMCWQQNELNGHECLILHSTSKFGKNGIEIYEGDYDEDGNCVSWCDECNGWEFSQIDFPTADIIINCHRCDGNFFFQDIIHEFEIVGNLYKLKHDVS